MVYAVVVQGGAQDRAGAEGMTFICGEGWRERGISLLLVSWIKIGSRTTRECCAEQGKNRRRGEVFCDRGGEEFCDLPQGWETAGAGEVLSKSNHAAIDEYVFRFLSTMLRNVAMFTT